MKAIRFVLLGLLLLLAAGCGAATGASDDFVNAIFKRYPELKDRPYSIAEVKRVVDGDTFETSNGAKVRLIGMNTPETVKPNSPVEFYGKEASDYTKKQLGGKKVYMFADAGDQDKYGRLLRYVFIQGETEMYNMAMLREGFANTMTVPPNVMFAKQFTEAERDARTNKRGLWNGGKEAPEAQKTVTACQNPQIKGNINAKNEKIYHTPESRSYAQTKPEMMFCTEEEAVKAGFRKAG